MEKILRISLKLNFTPNTLGCYGLIERYLFSLENEVVSSRQEQSICFTEPNDGVAVKNFHYKNCATDVNHASGRVLHGTQSAGQLSAALSKGYFSKIQVS